MTTVRFLAQAELDLAEAFDWYESQQTGLGREFADEIRTVCQHIAIDPAAHPIARGSIRRHPVNRFPFDLLFVAQADEVIVVAVAHHHRHPRTWWKRIPPRNPS